MIFCLFVSFHPADFGMYSLHFSSVFYPQTAGYPEAEGEVDKVVLSIAHSGYVSLQTSPRQIRALRRVQTRGSTKRGDKIQIHLSALVVSPCSSGSQES